MHAPIVGLASAELTARAEKALPDGVPGHMAPGKNWPGAPTWVARAEGSRFTDVDGKEYVDLMCSWGPIVLGYHHPQVEEAARQQHAAVDVSNGGAPVMVDLAERLTSFVEGGAWTRFFKNGGDATTLAITHARHHTGRRTILMVDGGYHGTLSWCNPDVRGVLPSDREHIAYFRFNDLDSLRAQMEAHAGDVAAVITAPLWQPTLTDAALPEAEFAVGARDLCDKHGALLILDEVRAGLRMAQGSSWSPFGVAPDLSCWGKALGNGYPIAALIGTEELRKTAADVFATGTFWGSAEPMAAALATLEIVEREKGLEAMTRWGNQFCEGITAAAGKYAIDIAMSGPTTMPSLRFIQDDDSRRRADIFAAACGAVGLYIHPRHNWFVSTAHDDRDLADALAAVDAGMEAVSGCED